MSTVPRSRTRLAHRLGWFAVATLVAASLVPSTFAAAPDTVIICHSTGSQTNPYVVHTPSKSGDVSGHADHQGPVWFPGITVEWGDIIPPFDYEGGSYPGLNWTAEGQAIYNNGCNIPAATTAPPTEAPTTAPPTEAPTTAPPTEAPTTAPPTEAPTTAPPTGEVLPTEAVPTTPGTTLPPTDTLGDSAAATGSDGWRIILLALAATLAAALLLTPARVVRKDR